MGYMQDIYTPHFGSLHPSIPLLFTVCCASAVTILLHIVSLTRVGVWVNTAITPVHLDILEMQAVVHQERA
jgi:hypothetical protein